MRALSSPSLAALLLPLLSGTALGQISVPDVTPTMLVWENDTVPNVGNIRTVIDVGVNDSGRWIAHVTTSGLADANEVILRNGFVTMLENTPLSQPVGARLDEFDQMAFNDSGNLVWQFTLAEQENEGENEGVYFNARALFVKLRPVNLPETFHPDTTWFRFDGVPTVNDRNQVLFGCDVEDPTIPSLGDPALFLVDCDDSGNVEELRAIIRERGPAPGLEGREIDKVTNGRGEIALNNKGDVLYQGKLRGSDANRVIWLNDQVIAQTETLGVLDRDWVNLKDETVGLNDLGDWAHTGQINASFLLDHVMVKNGELFLRENDTFPDIFPQQVQSLPSANALTMNLEVSNSRDLYHWSQWNGPTATNTGILRNREVLVRTGVTRMNGQFLSLLVPSPTGFDVSPSGRYVVFIGQMGANEDWAVGMLDLGLVRPLQGCGGNEGTLTREAGIAVVGKRVTLGMNDGQGVGVSPFLFVSDRPLSLVDGCGLSLPFGELLVDFGQNGNPFMTLIGTPWGNGPSEIDLDIANNPLLVEQTVYAQGIFFDIGNVVEGPRFQLTNALEITIGAP